jgi:hypothetical protein
MNTELATIFTDETAEFTCFNTATPCVDITDWPLTPPLITSLTPNPSYYVTPSISETGYFELQFMLANNYWGCSFNFGNNNTSTFPDCGAQIRQGIAHLVDKTVFTNNQPNIAGHAQPIDNPLPLNNGGLPTPNACGWDKSFPEGTTGVAPCVVGASSGLTPATFTGGTAYHLAAATGVNFVWQPALGSADFCAAAQHFINAGLATGRDATTCVLTGVSSAVTAHTVNLFIRIDNTARFQLGQSIAQELCALFGQGFATGCGTFVSVTPGPITAFPGFITSPTSVNLSWHIYTAGYGNVYPFDSSLYFIYNSRFVSGIPSIKVSGGGTCRNDSVGSSSASNYMYLCNTAYDAISGLMENAACTSATGDPSVGQGTPTFANCAGVPVTGTCTATSNCSAVTAGYQTEDAYGKGAYTVPVFIQLDQFGYLSNWSRVVNSAGSGTPTFSTWLSAWSGTPTQSGTIRQGFKQNIKSVSPFIESTVWDAYVFGNVYDSLGVINPAKGVDLLNWMATSLQTIRDPTTLGYTAPPGTTAALRISLRQDLFFQNDNSGSHPASRVTSWDVAFSYLSLLGTGAFQSGGASPTTGITVISPTTFDLDLSNLGSFTTLFELGLSVLPAEYWTGAGQSAYNSAVSNTISTCSSQTSASAVVACFRAQYTLSPTAVIGTSTVPAVVCSDSTIFAGASGCSHVGASLLNVDTTKIGATYDPVATGTLIGSGPWEAQTGGVVGGGTGVTPCGAMVCQTNPTYTLTRFGVGTAPGAGLSDHYFRSNGNLAIWVWSQDNGDFTHDFGNLQTVRACYNPGGTATGACVHWAKGIAGTGGTAGLTNVQIAAVNRFVAVNWVAPFNWNTSPPLGIVSLPPATLYEGTATLNNCVVDPVNGYDC